MRTVCLIPGDGVGREVIPAAAKVLATLLPGASFVEADAGWDCFQRQGTALPGATIEAVAVADGTLFGATQSPSDVVKGYHSPILALRKLFDLYANLRPTMSLLPGRPGLDFLIVRENTEGLYAGRERWEGDDTAIAERVITRRGCERIARAAFEQARRRAARPGGGRGDLAPTDLAARQSTVTIVHKANVLKLTDGLFRDACLAVAREYPEVSVREMLVDTAAMWLVKDPARFDVIVTTNLFGDILSDLCAQLVGGMGFAYSGNIGDRYAVFEPTHGSAPKYAGQGKVNPLASILAGKMMLEWLGEADKAAQIEGAVAEVIAEGQVRCYDMGGAAGTLDMARAIAAELS
jgi:homoisocitrate dehydrogenase